MKALAKTILTKQSAFLPFPVCTVHIYTANLFHTVSTIPSHTLSINLRLDEASHSHAVPRSSYLIVRPNFGMSQVLGDVILRTL